MASNKDLKAMMDARKAPRRAIPQTDPAELAAGPPEPEVAAAPPPEQTPTVLTEPAGRPADVPTAHESTRGLERQTVTTHGTPAPGARRMALTPVDTKEKPINRGFHMYPSRHQQLLDLASPYWEDRKPWEIIEQALAEYVERHYGEGQSIEQKK